MFCISGSFVLTVKEDDSIRLFIGKTERGKSRRKDMSPMGDKVKINFEFISILTDQMVLIILFLFSRPRDT